MVTSGSNALFTETISADAAAVQGQTYICEDTALLNGVVMADAAGAPVLETKTGITSHIFLNGDAILSVTDTSGLETRVSCLVPPPPK